MSELTHIAAEVVAIIAGLWALLRFVFEPRLKLSIQAELSPVLERVGTLERRASTSDVKLDGMDDAAQRTEQAIEKIGEQVGKGLEDLAKAIEKLADRHMEIEKDVAALKATRPRRSR